MVYVKIQAQVDAMLCYVHRVSRITRQDELHDLKVVKDLQIIVNTLPDFRHASFSFIGGRANGWGTTQSDLDVLIRVTSEGVLPMLEDLARATRRSSTDISVTRVVRKAIVPIVRLFHHETSREIDVSLATEILPREAGPKNTALLREYSRLLPQEVQAFQCFKWFLEGTRMFQGGKQFMCTYAYITVFIHFLRRRKRVPWINPATLEPAPDNGPLNTAKREASTLVQFLWYMIHDFPEGVISLREDPLSRNLDRTPEEDVVHIEATYEVKNLGRTLSARNLGELKNTCQRLLTRLVTEIDFSSHFNKRKLFPCPISEVDEQLMIQTMHSIKHEITFGSA